LLGTTATTFKMALVSYLSQDPLVFSLLAGVFGLAIGSFLNVVALRLPVMLHRQWRRQCREVLDLDLTEPEETFNLLTPRSRCPNCGHQIGALENIPVVSFLWLRGKCSACSAKIAWRYPTVESATAVLSAVVAWQFGFGWQAAGALLLTWSLIALTLIDYDEQLLPDVITLPLLWLGLLLSLGPWFSDPVSSIIGASAGYLSLWSLYHVFRLLTGKEGMGYGDFKLLALFGAWLGWQYLPQIILLSSLVGALVGIALIVFRGRDRAKPIPFGPYLAAAGWISLLWGPTIHQAYFRLSGLG
jgi:leader peptidase (prepilin peptidase)/N-methyltransferase